MLGAPDVALDLGPVLPELAAPSSMASEIITKP